MAISQRDFNRQCVNFVKKCKPDDGWRLMLRIDCRCEQVLTDSIDPNGNGELMLIKNEVKLLEQAKVCTCEYTVVYSESYEVPVMYFNMNDQSK